MTSRLDRWLATVSDGSRAQVKEWIRDGQIAVDGRVILSPAHLFDPETAQLFRQGKPLDGRLTRHVILHKPAGILTAARDRKQPTVMDLLPPVLGKIGCMPVGRLDKDTSGLLLLTTDGEMNHRLLSPARHVDKVYLARVAGRLSEADQQAFAAGLDLGDFTSMPAELTLLQTGAETSVARVRIREGKFHQVRRMFAAVGHEVITLHRLAFGPLTLEENLPEGAWRELTEAELTGLRHAVGMEPLSER